MGRFTKGLAKDTSPADQPPGTFRFARNTIINKVDGAISNEGGNKAVHKIGRHTGSGIADGYTVIGAIEITDDRIVLFSVNRFVIFDPTTGAGEEHEDYGRSEIGVYQEGDYKTVLNLRLEYDDTALPNIDTDLKFDPAHPIHGTYKINAKKDLIVYFTDNHNPPRSLNVSRQMRNEFGGGGTKWEKIYDVNPKTSFNKNYVDRINLFHHSGPVPEIDFKSINSGGGLTTAVYQLALAYVDVDLAATNYLTIDNPVSVVDDLENVLPIERYDGAAPGSQTGKSITWEIRNLNTDYEYIRPAVIQSVGGKQYAYQLNDLEIRGRVMEVTFTGAEGYQQKAIEDVVVDNVQYDKVKTLEQLDGVLYAGNLEGTLDVGFQKHCGDIVLKPRTKTLVDFEPVDVSLDNISEGYLNTLPPNHSREGSYRSVDNSYQYRGYLRNEVYAFYIAFILNDGRMSYAYHIPGRKASSNELTTSKIPQELKDISTNAKNFHFVEESHVDGHNNMNYWENANELYPNTPDYDNDAFKNDDGTMSRVRHHHFPSNDNSEFRFWQGGSASTTPIPAEDINLQWSVSGGENNVEYHTSGLNNHDWDPPYNDVPSQSVAGMTGNNWTAFKISNFGSTPPTIGENFRIRWKFDKFGDFTNDPVYRTFYGDLLSLDDQWALFNRTSGNAPDNLNAENRFKGATIYYEAQTPPGVNGTVDGDVKILGFDLEGVKVPQDIADKVQGFRIYYSKRKDDYKTILGQGIVTPYVEVESEIGGCSADTGAGNNSEEKLHVKYPFVTDSQIQGADFKTLAFYNFELLRRKNSIGAATHVTRVATSEYETWLGAGVTHTSPPDETEGDCAEDPLIRSTFGVLRSLNMYDHGYLDPAASDYSDWVINNTHFPIRERCKSYVRGDSIFDARGLGFGLKLYNRGGDSHMALALTNNLPQQTYASGYNTPISTWNQGGFPFAHQPSSRMLTHNINLCTFKEDTYNAIDTQDLVWTGYQVVGEDFNNFVEDGTFRKRVGVEEIEEVSADYKTNTLRHHSNIVLQAGSTPDNMNFIAASKGGIFGGDTFICRYGIRQTLSPRLVTEEANSRVSGLYTVIESSDNICYRHEEGVETSFYPGSPGKKFLFTDRAGKSTARENLLDFTAEENIKYNADYSRPNDTATAFPLPLLISQPTAFPTRVHRSVASDPGSLLDNYRVFRALQFKDLPKNRGSITNLTNFNNLLYIHTEDSLFKTKGKQSMQLGDGSQAFVGSGDIFAQAPDELVQTEAGYGGTRSQAACNVSKYGYFSVDQRNSRVYLTNANMEEISSKGMEKWFQANMQFEKLGQYGYVHQEDSPVSGLGFVSGWDYLNQRILLTKRDLIPTFEFEKRFNAGRFPDDPLYNPIIEPQETDTLIANTVLATSNFDYTGMEGIDGGGRGRRLVLSSGIQIVLNFMTLGMEVTATTKNSFSIINRSSLKGIAILYIVIPDQFNGADFNGADSLSTYNLRVGFSCTEDQFVGSSTILLVEGVAAAGPPAGTDVVWSSFAQTNGEIVNIENFVPVVADGVDDVDGGVAFKVTASVPENTTRTFVTEAFELTKIDELTLQEEGYAIQNGSIAYNREDNSFYKRTIIPKPNLINFSEFTDDDKPDETHDVFDEDSTPKPDDVALPKNIAQAQNISGEWTTGANWSIADGKATCAGTGTLSAPFNIELTHNAVYVIRGTVPEYTSGTLSVQIGNSYISSEEIVSANTLKTGSFEVTVKYLEEYGSTLKLTGTSFNGSINKVIAQIANISQVQTDGRIGGSGNFGSIFNFGISQAEIPADVMLENNYTLSNDKVDISAEPTVHQEPLFQRIGWTISYYPEFKYWGSFHDYLPSLYTYDSRFLYSFDNNIPINYAVEETDSVVFGENLFDMDMLPQIESGGGSGNTINNTSTPPDDGQDTITSHIIQYTFSNNNEFVVEFPDITFEEDKRYRVQMCYSISVVGGIATEGVYNPFGLFVEGENTPFIEVDFPGGNSASNCIGQEILDASGQAAFYGVEPPIIENASGTLQIKNIIQGANYTATTVTLTITNLIVEEFIPPEFEYTSSFENIWVHDDFDEPGSFYGFIYPFEIEFIENANRQDSKLYSSFGYETKVTSRQYVVVSGNDSYFTGNPARTFKDGFTNFIVYNDTQCSGLNNILYFRNQNINKASSNNINKGVRKVGNEWRINDFRDMAILKNSSIPQPFPVQSHYTGVSSTQVLVPGAKNLGATSVPYTDIYGTPLDPDGNQVDFVPMFYYDGMREELNPHYLDYGKPWHQQKKFIDTYMGIRLINDNLQKNLVNLYSTSVAMRKFNR
tara:strand:+ start:1292 stop:8206 length:6915 start_codon:yes stop_codon:yes gene_type:complete